MLKNYLTIAINNLLKNKLYSTINIIGLAVGLAACIVIALYVKDQYSYDTQWENSDRIYRVNWEISPPGEPTFKTVNSPMPAMPILHEYFKDKIEYSTRAFPLPLVLNIGISRFEDEVAMIDPAFINIFQLEELAGSLKNIFNEPMAIALSAESAKKYFGAEDPIGKPVTGKILGFELPFKVTAVYRIPGNTVLDIPFFTSNFLESYLPPSQNRWGNHNARAYFLLKEGVDIEALNSLTPSFIDKHKKSPFPDLKASEILFLEYQKLEEAHLNSPWDNKRAGGNKTVVLSFAVIAILVLLIGCINFTILTTAKATQRAREVAMRKVVGAKRKQLIIQFLGESTLIVLIAMILSMGVVEIMLPVFESIVGINLSLDYTSPLTYLPLLTLLFIVGISGGMYPAFILSGFKPGNTLRVNQSKEASGSISLRTILVIFQFSISIILIIATGVIYTQMQYSLNRDPGYNKDNLLVINQLFQHLYPDLKTKMQPLKQELLKLSNVTDVSVSDHQPSNKGYSPSGFRRTDQPEIIYQLFDEDVGYDFFKTYQISVIAGRSYSPERDTPVPTIEVMTGKPEDISEESPERSVMINEKASKILGFANAEDAVGKTLINNSRGKIRYTIIGVVGDNHMYSINAPPKPEVYLLEPVQAHAITLRYTGSPQAILRQVKSVFNKVIGDLEIHTGFVNQIVAQEFENERTEVKILVSFSLLAIIIACMGLFGSASFTVERRTKEIGLRKVMGAKVKNIVCLLLWQFSKPVLLANIIAWPVAIFAMQSWLERFAYRLSPLYMIPICLASGLIALLIAWLTVAGNTTRVARTNPIHSLRYE